MAKAAAIADYRHKLKEHDWSFEYSDDQGVWRQGRKELGELQQLQRQLDPDYAIWNSIAPEGYRVSKGA
jgi:hypothetical protein